MSQDTQELAAAKRLIASAEHRVRAVELYQIARNKDSRTAQKCTELDVGLLEYVGKFYTNNNDFDLAIECFERILALEDHFENGQLSPRFNQHFDYDENARSVLCTFTLQQPLIRNQRRQSTFNNA